MVSRELEALRVKAAAAAVVARVVRGRASLQADCSVAAPQNLKEKTPLNSKP